MSWLKKIKDSINPGEDDDNTYDDDEFEDDYSVGGGGFDSDVSDAPVSGGFQQQQNPVYAQNSPDYRNYQQPANNHQPATPVTSIMGEDPQASVEMKVIRPETFNDGKRIVDLLMARKTVIINFEETNKEIIRKLMDFTAGAVYTLKGGLTRVSAQTFIVTPPNAKVTEEQIRNAERGDIGREPPVY